MHSIKQGNQKLSISSVNFKSYTNSTFDELIDSKINMKSRFNVNHFLIEFLHVSPAFLKSLTAFLDLRIIQIFQQIGDVSIKTEQKSDRKLKPRKSNLSSLSEQNVSQNSFSSSTSQDPSTNSNDELLNNPGLFGLPNLNFSSSMTSKEKLSYVIMSLLNFFYIRKKSITGPFLAKKTKLDFIEAEVFLRFKWLIRQKRHDVHFMFRHNLLHDRRLRGLIFCFRKAKKAFKWQYYRHMKNSLSERVRKKIKQVNLSLDFSDLVGGPNNGFPFISFDKCRLSEFHMPFLDFREMSFYGIRRVKGAFFLWNVSITFSDLVDYILKKNPSKKYKVKAEFTTYIHRSKKVQIRSIELVKLEEHYKNLQGQELNTNFTNKRCQYFDGAKNALIKDRISPSLDPRDDHVPIGLSNEPFSSGDLYTWGKDYFQVYKIHPFVRASFCPFTRLRVLEAIERIFKKRNELEKKKSLQIDDLKPSFIKVTARQKPLNLFLNMLKKSKLPKTEKKAFTRKYNIKDFFKRKMLKTIKKKGIFKIMKKNNKSREIFKYPLGLHKMNFDNILKRKKKQK